MPRRLVPSVVLVLLGAPGAGAQDSLRVVPGWGVDTAPPAGFGVDSWGGAVPEIYRAWRAYLRSNPARQAPTPLWSAAEQRQWPRYDLTATVAYQGFPATVLDIRPAHPGATDEYVVKTLFAAAVGEERDVKPLALTRVYAVREGGRWVFANALPRLTRGWRRERVGPITYVVQPGQRFDRARAARAVRFADSLAAAFAVPRITGLTYYVTDSPDEVHRIMGVDWTVGGAGYGYANYPNRLIFTGDPALGEEYRHELVHFVLTPLSAGGRVHPMINEGVATWLGGSLGRDFPTLMREYAAFLQAHPRLTLDSLVFGEYEADMGVRPAGAALALMVYERGGVDAVKALLASGRTNEELRAALQRVLGRPWPEIATQWRARVLAFGAAGRLPDSGGVP